jgi:hypothetical protein
MPVHSHDRIAADLAHRRHHADRHVLLVNQPDRSTGSLLLLWKSASDKRR